MNKVDLMKKAFKLAERGRGLTGTNPMVGALIVKNKKIIGKGYHEKFGGPHAEVNAILDAEKKGFNLNGSVLFTTLEPCCHKNKKTPPCTEIIVSKGIKKVYYGAIDVNPKVNGQGINQLKKNNVKVSFVNFQNINEKLNRGYSKIITKKQPFVTLKICMTLDGMIYNRSQKNSTIGDSEQLTHSNNLRKEHDGVLVGINTIINDNPRLTYRGAVQNIIQPRPIILDSKLKTPANSKFIKMRNNPIILTNLSAKSRKAKILTELGCKVLTLKKISPANILKNLIKNNIQSVLIEGGGEVFVDFLKSKMFHELILYYTEIFMGNSGMNIGKSLNSQYKLKVHPTSIKKVGNSIVLVFVP